MSKGKDRERAEQGELHREGKKVSVEGCLVPGCDRLQDPNASTPHCAHHADIIATVVYALPHLNVQITQQKPVEAAPGIIIPTPGQERQVIWQFRKRSEQARKIKGE